MTDDVGMLDVERIQQLAGIVGEGRQAVAIDADQAAGERIVIIDLPQAVDALAIALILEHGFQRVGLNRMELKADARNNIFYASGVKLINLTGGVFVNQSAAFSDFHGTGANPAANAALTDAAYVAPRFRVIQSRRHA